MRVGAALVAGLVLATGGCKGSAPSVAELAPIPSAKPVERGAVGDKDLHVLLAELAASKACQMIQGQFRPVRAIENPDLVTGLIWVRDCHAKANGTQVSVMLSGNGWQWADQQQHKAGGTFGIRQYVKFGMTATLPGEVDVAYQPSAHILSLWFTPEKPPEVSFQPVGGVEVDAKGTWSSIVGALGSVFGKSPAHLGNEQAKVQGGHQLEGELADGFSVTINLCTGLSRFNLGRHPKGAMDIADAGESKSVPIELQPSGLLVFGPQLVGPAGYSANVEVLTGSAHIALACRNQAEALAAAYVEGKPLPTIDTLAAATIRGKGTLRVAKANCEVSLIATPSEPEAVKFDWQRPPAEVARSTGGPLVSCSSTPTAAPSASAAH
ncbi:MAG: hypothetical protein ABI548_15320 [Polyangiaceae bacterium]